MAAAVLVLAAAIPLSGRQSPSTNQLPDRSTRANALAPGSGASSSKPVAAQAPSVRTTDARLAELLKTGTGHSSTFRKLVTHLDQSSVVVYVDCAPAMEFVQRTVPAGRLVFIAYVEGIRYLAVRLDCRPNDVRQLAALAHELQHAVEVADAPEVQDRFSMATLYRSIGHTARYTGSTEAFETAAAQAAGDATSNELAAICAGCRTLEDINTGGG